MLPIPTAQPLIEIMELSATEWCVCDADIHTGDARRVLGYVNRGRTGFDVLALRSTVEDCGSFPDWDSALDCISHRMLQ